MGLMNKDSLSGPRLDGGYRVLCFRTTRENPQASGARARGRDDCLFSDLIDVSILRRIKGA